MPAATNTARPGEERCSDTGNQASDGDDENRLRCQPANAAEDEFGERWFDE